MTTGKTERGALPLREEIPSPCVLQKTGRTRGKYMAKTRDMAPSGEVFLVFGVHRFQRLPTDTRVTQDPGHS